MIGDVAATPRLVHLDAARGQLGGRGEDVAAAAVAAHAKRQHVRMLDQQEQIADLAALPLFDERALERQRLGVGSAAQVGGLR